MVFACQLHCKTGKESCRDDQSPQAAAVLGELMFPFSSAALLKERTQSSSLKCNTAVDLMILDASALQSTCLLLWDWLLVACPLSQRQ